MGKSQKNIRKGLTVQSETDDNLGLVVLVQKCNCKCRVLLASGHLSSVWDHSVHVAKLPNLSVSKGFCSHNFRPISNTLYGSSYSFHPISEHFMRTLLTMREYMAVAFLDIRPSFKMFVAL